MPALVGRRYFISVKKKSCHEENDSKEEENLSYLLLSGCESHLMSPRGG
jgi:hypothetical protein